MAAIPAIAFVTGAVGAGALISAIERKREENRIFEAESRNIGTPAVPAAKSQAVVLSGEFVRGLEPNRMTQDGRRVPHWGVDISGNLNTPVYALKSGTIVFAGPRKGYGQTVFLQFDEPENGGLSALYAHLNKISVRRGERIMGGQQIGLMGKTSAGPDGVVPDWGRGMGVHLHMEIHNTSTPNTAKLNPRIDPVAWLHAEGIRYALV